MKKKLWIVLTGTVAVLGACQTVNPETVRDMPTAYLCKLLGDGYITKPSERRAIFAELETRNAECIATQEIRVRVIEE